MKNPLVSVIIPTKNSAKYIGNCLANIRNQNYKNIEIIISDGLSTDNTLKIAKKYGVRVVCNNKILAEPGVKVGLNNAKGEILIIMAIDNIFKNNNAIETIVSIFKDKQIFAAFPKHDYHKSGNYITKYINVFTDPFNHFVYGYAANARTFNKVFDTIFHSNIYDIYDFKSSKLMPVIALAQGFSVRKEFIKKQRNEMDDIFPILELIKENKKIAYVHSISLYHNTVNSLRHFIRKQRWGAKNALTGKNYGINSRLITLSAGQKIRMYIFPIYSLSIIFPIINSIIHLIRDREVMWIYHPFISFVSGISIIYEYVKIKLGLSTLVSRI
jgi:glycosyltransferase involved in cell wall biosynthesis